MLSGTFAERYKPTPEMLKVALSQQVRLTDMPQLAEVVVGQQVMADKHVSWSSE